MLGLGRRLLTKPLSCHVLKQKVHINADKIYKTRIAAANHRQLSSLQLGGRVQSVFSQSSSPYLSNSNRRFSNDCKMGGENCLPCPVQLVEDIENSKYDAVCVIDPDYFPEQLEGYIKECRSFDKAFDSQVSCFKAPDYEKPFIYSPVGELSDYHDIRVFQKAVAKAINRAIKAGSKKPLIVIGENSKFKNVELCVILGALEELYVPIQLREDVPDKKQRVESLQIYFCGNKRDDVFKQALLLESARFIARDIGVGDPERMTAIKVENYVKPVFKDLEMTVISDVGVLTKEYPLFQAVNRAACAVPRHQGRIIFLRYKPPQKARKSLLLVGKGVTYDTGGADIKAGGIMAGMSRDKCGAAAVAGFMKLVQELKPPDIEVIGAMCMVRNSFGADSYLSDEIITSRSGLRVRVGNTDAEGRMCMADPLTRIKELALELPDPHIFTIATLTGHSRLAVGIGYSIAMDNSVAQSCGHAWQLKKTGSEFGDPFEISVLRSEDFTFNAPQAIGEDIRQCNSAPSSRTHRGHQLVQEKKPSDIEVIAALCMVRNSVGEECYVSDEVLTSRAGVRVRVGNTDAEGRMCMADALAKMKELAQNLPDPHLFTIATLTGHACLAVGEGYSIAIDNSVARKIGHAEQLKKIGDEIGEPFEISTLRDDDFQYNASQVIGEDLRQCGNLPSSRTGRGHQVPAAFMICATGLDKHGLSSSKPLKYTHIDIAASAGEYPKMPTGAPIVALAKTHLDL